MRQSGRVKGAAGYGCLEEAATVTPREQCSRKKGQRARRPPGGQGIGTVAGWKARMVVASHMRGRWEGGGKVTRHRSGRVCQTDDKTAFECASRLPQQPLQGGLSLGQRTTF